MPIQWTAAIFKRLQARYGSKWIAAIEGIEEECIEEWSNDLSGVTPAQIKGGLERWSEDWPPSSPEFAKCCKNVRAECHRPFPKLEVIRSTKQTASEAIENMRRLYLGG